MSSTQPLGDYHFVLMHGFANTSAEFSRLYDWLREHGYDVTSVTLPFHSSEEDFREFDIDVFMTDFQSELQSVLQGKDLKRVVLISTSLSSLALINAKMSLVGVKHVMLAPYLGTGSWRSRLLGLFDRILPKLWFSRRRDVDLRSDRGDFALSQKLKVGAAMQVERLAQRVGLESSGYPNGTLVIHSHADTVAAFRNSSQFFEKNRGDSDFVTLLGAPHSFANNLDPSSLIELVESHFLSSEFVESDQDSQIFATQFVELNVEHRNWAGKVFSLIVGFVTAFSVLTYQTLGDVLDGTPSAPYFLMAYATIIYLYVLVTSLYFYYMNRTQSYLSSFVEPAMPGVGFQQYKLSKNLSGAESVSLTFNTSFALIVMPFFMATGAVAYVIIAYSERVFSFELRNAFLQFWLLTNFILYCLSQISAFRLAISTKKTIYAPPVPFKRSRRKIEAVASLVLSSDYRA